MPTSRTSLLSPKPAFCRLWVQSQPARQPIAAAIAYCETSDSGLTHDTHDILCAFEAPFVVRRRSHHLNIWEVVGREKQKNLCVAGDGRQGVCLCHNPVSVCGSIHHMHHPRTPAPATTYRITLRIPPAVAISWGEFITATLDSVAEVWLKSVREDPGALCASGEKKLNS